MGDIIQDQEDIAVFWDFDSTKSQALNSELQPSEIVQNIRSSVFPYGSIKSFRAYGNFSGQALVRATNVRSDLLASGLTLIDCPNDGRKDLGVKIMLVDMVTHAWNHSTPHTFAIITADRDIAYCISTLRMRKYRVLVICPPDSHSDLKAQASCQLDWNLSILGNAHHEDDFRNGDIFEDIRPAKKPNSFSVHTPAAPGSSASSYQHQTSQPANAAGPRAHEQERPASAAADLFELHDLPARSRRNSMFSSSFRPHKFDVFGDIGTEDVSPKLPRGAFGLGDGPLLPRSQSRFGTPSRPDSVPSNYMYPSVLSKPPYTPQPDKASTSGGTTGSTWKGKERSFLEPEVIAPQAPPTANYDSLVPEDILDFPEPAKADGGAPSGTFSFSVPRKSVEAPAATAEAFNWKSKDRAFPILEPESVAPEAPPPPSYDPFTSKGLFERPTSMKADTGNNATAAYPSGQARAPSITSSTSSSSKSSRRSSLPSLDHKTHNSTAPTSADIALGHDKQANQPMLRDSAMELLYQTFDSVPHTFEQSAMTVDEVREAVRSPVPERIPTPPKVEKKTQTPTPQPERPTKAEPQPPSTVNQNASSSSSKPPKPVPKQNPPAASSKVSTQPLPKASPPPLIGENARYKSLVEVLRANERASSRITTKTVLGDILVKHDKNVYRSQIGSSKNFFKKYIAGAVAAGIVGETDDRQSVRLLPPYAL